MKQDSALGYGQLVKSYWKKQGLKGFYQGYLPNVAAAVPIRVSIFGTYSFVTEQGRYTSYSPVTIGLFAGALTGLFESTILCPADAYRVRKTLPDTAKLPFYPSYLFKGYSSLLLMTSLENTICLLGADFLIKLIANDNDPVAPMSRFLCALFAGAGSQYISIPFDNVKTRKMKLVDQSYREVVSSLYKEGGFGTFFRSAHAKAGRAGVCNAMMIGTSKLIVDHMDSPKI